MARQKLNPKDKKVEKPWERSDITMPIEEEFSIPRVQVRLTHFQIISSVPSKLIDKNPSSFISFS